VCACCCEHSCCWFPLVRDVFNVAGLPACAGIPGSVGFSSVAFLPAVAGVSSVVGYSAVDFVPAVAGVPGVGLPADPGVSMLFVVGIFTYCIDNETY
jgi:hypothetical protein